MYRAKIHSKSYGCSECIEKYDICLNVLSMHLKRQKMQAHASFQRQPNPLTIISEEKSWEKMFFPNCTGQSDWIAKFSAFFNIFHFTKCSLFTNYPQFVLNFVHRPVSLSDAPCLTIYHTPPTLYSTPSKFSICFLFCCAVSQNASA